MAGQGRSEPISIKNSKALPGGRLSANAFPSGTGFGFDLRNRLPISRRSTLADKPELDQLLQGSMINYKGSRYLPLTKETIHRLSPFWKGVKPIADMSLFESVMITKEVNHVHADHVIAALERIGDHCKYLLVIAPIHTSELGNVFNREAGNISTFNDWEKILACFPNLKWLMFVHPFDVPVDLSRGTYAALHTAIARRQAIPNLKSFHYDGPPGMLTDFAHNTASTTATTTTSDN